jgi:Family of unknown function (DUF6317)
MDGFQVTMTDLQAAAKQFQAEAGTFAGALPGSGPAPVDGGSWVINDAMSMVLGSIGRLHTQLVAAVENDAATLDANYAEYRHAENTIVHEVTAIATVPKGS